MYWHASIHSNTVVYKPRLQHQITKWFPEIVPEQELEVAQSFMCSKTVSCCFLRYLSHKTFIIIVIIINYYSVVALIIKSSTENTAMHKKSVSYWSITYLWWMNESLFWIARNQATQPRRDDQQQHCTRAHATPTFRLKPGWPLFLESHGI